MDIEKSVMAFIRENFFYEGPDLDPRASFLEKGVIDSTGVLELVGFLEETYGISVADEDLTPENLDGLALVAAYVERKRANAEV